MCRFGQIRYSACRKLSAKIGSFLNESQRLTNLTYLAMAPGYSFHLQKPTLRGCLLEAYSFIMIVVGLASAAPHNTQARHQACHLHLYLLHGHRKTPALLMTPSKSFNPTPLPTPLPPLASNSISFIICSPTSSFNALATLFRQAIVILPSSPPMFVNNLNASSTSLCWLSSLLLLNLSAATATKCA